MSGKLSAFAGLYNASDFAYGINSKVPPLQVVLPVTGATGAQTLTLAFPSFNLPDGTIVPAPNTNAPIWIGGNSNQETITPSAVSVGPNTSYSQSTITGTFTYAHGNGDSVRSGTIGLQEALNYCASKGGGTVVIDAGWKALGGTDAIYAAATVPSGVEILDNRVGITGVSSSLLTKTVTIANAAMLTLHSVPVKLVDAPGAGDIIEVTNLAINFIFDTSAPTGGGNLTAGYDTTATPAASGTIATALVTSAAANTFGSTYGATTPGASSGMINKGLYLTAASADFTNGASGHGSMVVTVNYRVLTTQV